jgi:Ion channel
MRSLLRRNFAFWTQERSLSALLIYLLISIIVWLPLSENEPWQELIQDIIFNLILLAGCFSVVAAQGTRVVLYVLAVNAFVFRGLEFLNDQYVILQMEILMSAMFFTLLGLLIMRYVLEDEESTSSRIQGAVIVYIVFGLVCGLLYHSIWLNNQDAFNFTSIKETEVSFAYLLYFSFTIQTTVGPGDIFPVSSWAKSLVILQSMFGMLYPVVIIARLVTLEIEHAKIRIREKKSKDKPGTVEHHIATKIKEPHHER